jgi:hypothetical protein
MPITPDKLFSNVVGIANLCGLDGREVGVPTPVGSNFSLLHVVQTGSGIHPISYSIGTRGSYHGA